MKIKGLLAASLGIVILLAGCESESGDSERSSSEYSDSSSLSSSIISTVDSSEQSTSTTETKQSISSSSSSSEPEEVKNEIPTPYISRVYYYDGIVQLEWKTNDSDFMVDESYNLRIFQSSTDGQEKTKEVFAWKPIMFSAKQYLFSGENYFRIQLYNSIGESEISDLYCFSLTGTSGASDVHQYTHTFEAPNGFVIVPDYSDAINDINNGVQPTQFYADITFICPSCGGKNYMPGKYFSCTEDSSAYCRMQCSRDTRCPYNKYSYVYINSYAVQIS